MSAKGFSVYKCDVEADAQTRHANKIMASQNIGKEKFVVLKTI
uniref:Uncharacterized protein n=1 Tax=Oryza glumipatula TaxID=40148 RepID=A0A0E0BJJ1_9ORYZ